MNQQYLDIVRLLIDVAPAVFASPRFAMKGGTAINLFVQDLPRLSVGIDVVFTDHTLLREQALEKIAQELAAVRSRIQKMGFRARLLSTSHGDEVKMLVEQGDARLKVEVNFVFRGTVLPVVRRNLVPAAQELLTADVARYARAIWQQAGGSARPTASKRYVRCGLDAANRWP